MSPLAFAVKESHLEPDRTVWFVVHPAGFAVASFDDPEFAHWKAEHREVTSGETCRKLGLTPDVFVAMAREAMDSMLRQAFRRRGYQPWWDAR